MRTMFDGIVPGEVPAGAQLYAAYEDGHWPDFTALLAQHPGAIGVPISVSAGYDGGKVLDVENGDATPAESVNWVLGRRRAGIDPTVYCNTSTWPQVRAAFQARGVPEPHYWLAQYDGIAEIPAGAVAKQYADRGGYDISAVADYWPGVDPPPAADTPPQHPTSVQEDDDMQPYLISVTPDPSNAANKGAGIFLVQPTGAVVHIPTAADEAEFVNLFGQVRPVSAQMYVNLVAAAPKAG